MTMLLAPEVKTPAWIPSERSVIDLVMVTVPNPPGSSTLISPPVAVFEIAPAKVLHGAVLEHIQDLPRAYRELRRVVKRGRLLYLACSPIWSSYRGHHYNHWLADYVDLIAPWDHLCSDKAALAERIRAEMGEAVAADAIAYIYESDYLNRLSVREHKRLIGESGFEVLEIT